MQPDYYQILGVFPSASARAIKSAHRGLVKKYHPDLFSRDADKARATDKLQRINAAYAVLGNAKRRREYDEDRLAKTATRKRTPDQTSRTAGRSSSSIPRRNRVQKKSSQRRQYAVSLKWAAFIFGVAILAWLGYAANNEPQIPIAWMLVQNTVEEPTDGASGLKAGTPKWSSLARYSSRSQCVDGLKAMVKKDEREGSKAILDEEGGTVGITVYIKDMTKRVKNYDCREVRIVQPDSWLRSIWRRLGLS